MRKVLVIILLLMPLYTWAQYTISGKVIDLYNKKPVAKASVFLSNTTVGGSTAEDGSYSLNNVKPGKYDMVISAVGYETAYQSVMVDKQIIIPYTELTPRTIALNAVVVKPDAEWQRNYNLFKDDFFGQTEYAQQCKILNPEILDLEFNRAKNTLTATSSDYLIIENLALGYKLRYLLTHFTKQYRIGQLYYEGNVLFEPMKGKPAQMRKWNKNRLNAYNGSSKHYLTALIGNKLKEEGFKTLRLARKPNPARPPDSVIQAKLQQFRASLSGQRIMVNDSLSYWASQNRLPKTVEYLYTQPLRIDSLVRFTDQKGLYALAFDDILYVLYTKKKSDNSYANRPLNAPDNLTSLVNIIAKYAFFDNNGVIANPSAVMMEGNWATSRVANLLPVDYDATEKEKK